MRYKEEIYISNFYFGNWQTGIYIHIHIYPYMDTKKDKNDTTQPQMFQKVESDGGPFLKVGFKS